MKEVDFLEIPRHFFPSQHKASTIYLTPSQLSALPADVIKLIEPSFKVAILGKILLSENVEGFIFTEIDDRDISRFWMILFDMNFKKVIGKPIYMAENLGDAGNISIIESWMHT